MKLGIDYGRAITLGVAAAVIALASPGSASAQRGAGGGGGFFNNPALRLWTALDRGFERLSEELSLTEAQTDSVTRLLADFREENKSAPRSLDGHHELHALTHAGPGRREGRWGARRGRRHAGHAGNARSDATARTRTGIAPRGSHRAPGRGAGQDAGQAPRTPASARMSRPWTRPSRHFRETSSLDGARLSPAGWPFAAMGNWRR